MGETVGRTIVPYEGFFLQKVHRAAGRVLALMMEAVIGSCSFNLPATVDLVQRVKCINETMRMALAMDSRDVLPISVSVVNEDLVGFFLAPPQDISLEIQVSRA